VPRTASPDAQLSWLYDWWERIDAWIDAENRALPGLRPPVDVPPSDVPPSDVPPADVPPADVSSPGVPPADMPPTDVPPADVPAGT
jgi:hypothetical protein